MLSLRVRCCNTVRNLLEAKLFYSVWIRYMIESNLKITHNCIFYLAISASMVSGEDKMSTITRIVLLALIVSWPFICAIILLSQNNRLEEPRFRRKCVSMYNGLRTKRKVALLYTSLFCMRRLLLVCSLLALQSRQVWLIIAFNGLQSGYFWYMALVRPHTETIHNRLEHFNELCLMTMQYLMFFFIAGGTVEPET
mmetsp:Transcript_44219/g.58692  ORF Transcript_44219/g.58692 Transcript_44219/m.58692 type:complete len:196 (+) Transcript_44219:538-1125(+)